MQHFFVGNSTNHELGNPKTLIITLYSAAQKRNNAENLRFPAVAIRMLIVAYVK